MKNSGTKTKKIFLILFAIIFFIFFSINIEQKTESYGMKKIDFTILHNNFCSIKENVYIIDNTQKTNVISTLQTYEDYSQFPFESMSYVSNDTYEDLKQIYAGISFQSEFKKGNIEMYDFYKEKYRKLLGNEITFYDTETNRDYYLEQYGSMKVYDDEEYDLNQYTYIFFDIDEDNAPELCVTKYLNGTKTKRFIYIFKYDAGKDKMTIWKNMDSSRYFLIGSRMMEVDRDGRFYRFFIWNKDGEVELEVSFIDDDFFSNGIPIYMVSLPVYADVNMPEEMKKEGYYGETEASLYFRLTEEQYQELTAKFFQAGKEAEINLEKVTYTYEELFNSRTRDFDDKE